MKTNLIVKTTGTLLIEELGYYDNQVSQKLGKYLRDFNFKENSDYITVKIPNPTGNGEIISAKGWKYHTWKKIKEEIKKIKILL